MVIGIIGENCTGKSTPAEKLKREFGGRIVTGKDYLRLAKSESEARLLFKKQLADALGGENLIYVISEKEHIALLPAGAVRILVTADLDTIKERFRARMHGNLPAPVEKMLTLKHGSFDGEECDFRYDGAVGDFDALLTGLKALWGFADGTE